MNSRSTIGGGVVGSGSSGRSSGATVLPVDRIAKKLDQDLVINNEVVMQEFSTSFNTPFSFLKGGISSTRNVLGTQKYASDVKYVSVSSFPFKDVVDKNYITLDFVTTSLGYLSLSSTLVESQPWMIRKGMYYDLYQSTAQIKDTNQANLNLLKSNIDINNVNYESVFTNFIGKNYYLLLAKDELNNNIKELNYYAETDISLYKSSSFEFSPDYYVNCGAVDSDTGNIFIGGSFKKFTSPAPTGSVLTVALPGVADRGTGYSINDVLTINGGNNNATIKILATGSGGYMTSYTLTSTGSGYYAGFTSTSGGTGTGANVIIAVNVSDPTGYFVKTNSTISTLDNNFSASINGAVSSVYISGSTVYIGGDFTTVNGVSRQRFAALDKATGQLLNISATTNGIVYSITGSGNTLYVGGLFTTISGSARNRIAALNAANGNVLPWNPNVGSTVNHICLSGSNVYFGGQFTTVSGSTRNRVACVDATTGQLKEWDPSVNTTNSIIYRLYHYNDNIFICGYYNNISGSTRNGLSSVNKDTGNVSSFSNFSASTVTEIKISNNFMYIGGVFSTFSSSYSGIMSSSRIAILNLSNFSGTSVSLTSTFSSPQIILPYTKDDLFVGGLGNIYGNKYGFKLSTSSSINNFK